MTVDANGVSGSFSAAAQGKPAHVARRGAAAHAPPSASESREATSTIPPLVGLAIAARKGEEFAREGAVHYDFTPIESLCALDREMLERHVPEAKGLCGDEGEDGPVGPGIETSTSE